MLSNRCPSPTPPTGQLQTTLRSFRRCTLIPLLGIGPNPNPPDSGSGSTTGDDDDDNYTNGRDNVGDDDNDPDADNYEDDYEFCDYSLTYDSLDDLNAAASNIRSDCLAGHTMQVLNGKLMARIVHVEMALC